MQGRGLCLAGLSFAIHTKSKTGYDGHTIKKEEESMRWGRGERTWIYVRGRSFCGERYLHRVCRAEYIVGEHSRHEMHFLFTRFPRFMRVISPRAALLQRLDVCITADPCSYQPSHLNTWDKSGMKNEYGERTIFRHQPITNERLFIEKVLANYSHYWRTSLRHPQACKWTLN